MYRMICGRHPLYPLDGKTIQYGYDFYGDLTTVTDRDGNVTSRLTVDKVETLDLPASRESFERYLAELRFSRSFHL